MKSSFVKLICLLFLFGFLPACMAQSASTKITGMYSDMSYQAQTGDVLGEEIFIVYTNKGYYVVFQASQGEPGVPVVLPAKVHGASVTFNLPADVDPRGSFSGKVTGDELVGVFKRNAQSVHLQRKKSYWQ